MSLSAPTILFLFLAGWNFESSAILSAQAPTPVTVPTWRYDLTHAGQNTNETALTPSNVNVNSFAKLFSVAVDGALYAQPLYVPGLTMNDGLVHNVLFVATEHDSVYAFDADSNGGTNALPLWQISLLTSAHGAGAGATTVSSQAAGSPDISPEIGVTGTPVINPATNTIYLVSATQEGGQYYSRLHAINILTGAEQPNSPVTISATVPGTGNGSSGGNLSFSPLWQNQRTAVEYYNGHVYFAYASHGDNGPWHGWIFSYDATSLAQTAVVCTSPNGHGAGIWESGAGLPIDEVAAGGRMFLATGNGPYSSKYPPFSASTQFGESIVDFSLANGGLTPTDAFTPFNADHLNAGDLDQGSGGILMLPDQPGTHPHILIQAGKEGRILVLDRDQLGGFATEATSNKNILQDIPSQIHGLWSTPAYWNGNIYTWGENDVPKLFQINNGVMSVQPSSQSPVQSSFPGASFTVSSNGTQDGVAWAVKTDAFKTYGNEVLYAWDANDLTTPLYKSDTMSARDNAGPAMKFAIPMVTNGKVYVPAKKQVDVYGLMAVQPSANAPTITPNGGTFDTDQQVEISSATSQAQILYTLDGSVPTTTSTLYSGPITVGTNTTIRAIASYAGYVQSGVSSATFTFSNQTPSVTFSPAAGTYTKAQQVVLSDSDVNATIYFTLDGSTPTASSTIYSGPITVSSSATINAIAIDPTLTNSNGSSAAYVIQSGTTPINFPNGFSSIAGLKLNGSTVNTNDTRLQLTTGKLRQAGSVFATQTVNVQSFTTDFSFQLSAGTADGITFTIQNKGVTALGSNGAGLGYAAIGKSVAVKFDMYSNAGEGTDSTGVYSNGAVPTLPASSMSSSGVVLRSGDSMQAHITYNGTTLTMTLTDPVVRKSYTLKKTINIPKIVGANKAYVGFTGSTGGVVSSQKLLYWTYSTP